MIWIGIIIGIVIWQVCSLIFYYIWMHNEEKAIVASAGIAGGIVLLVGNTYIWFKKLRHVWFFKAALMKEGDEQIYYCRSKDSEYYIHAQGYRWATELRNKYTIEDGWRKGDCSFGTINIRYTPNKILKKENAKPLPKISKELREDY